ncbi:MAG TPA: winged helix-turn-helix transcriptional regulator [Chthoniobacterales bacterium]
MQEDFRDKVLLALLRRNRMTIAELARRINRPRPTVSVAINQGRFREVRAAIEKELQLT